jgi:hypothetical protein
VLFGCCLAVCSDSYTASISDSKQSREVDLNRYVSVFRTTTLHALQVYPTTIADSIAALRQFIKQTVHCYAVQQWPTFGANDVAKMVSNLLVATIKQYTFSQSSEPVGFHTHYTVRLCFGWLCPHVLVRCVLWCGVVWCG